MAAKAKVQVTISRVVDIASVIRYYLLQSSTTAAPTKPTANPPGGNWTTTEPSYTNGSTNSLYFVDITSFTNGTWKCSEVSKSSSYEAAKAAYAKAYAVEGELALYVKKDANDQIVSMINASANQIALKSNRLTIDSDNFKLAADGTITATGANLRGDLFLDNGVRIKQASTAEGEGDDSGYCIAWEVEDGISHTSRLCTPMGTRFGSDVLVEGELYFKDLNTPVNDVVVADGTSADWYWRKWASGKAECWSWWTALYANAYVLNRRVTLPFAFTDIFCTLATINDRGQDAASAIHWNCKAEPSGTSQVVLSVHNANGGFGQGSALKCSLEVRGRWK